MVKKRAASWGTSVFAVLLALLAFGCKNPVDPPGGDDNDPPVVEEKKSKLSIHTGGVTPTGYEDGQVTREFVAAAKPTTIKLFDDFAEAEYIKEVSPETIIIGRAWVADNGDWESLDTELGEDPAAVAARWWDAVNDKVLANPSVDYWEGINEPTASGQSMGVTAMTWYAQFEVERMKILDENGAKAVIGCFAMGTPDITLDDDGKMPVWEAFKPALQAAVDQYDGILGLHEYATPMHKWFGEDMDPDEAEQFADIDQEVGFLCGRYRIVYHRFLKPNGLEIPIVITESGVDGYAPAGWRNHYGRDAYKAQLVWYDKVLQEDEYVLGAQLFAVEMYGWEDFDLLPIMDWMGSYVGGDRSDLGNATLPPTTLGETKIEHLGTKDAETKLYTSFQWNLYGWEPMKLQNGTVGGTDLGWSSDGGDKNLPQAEQDNVWLVWEFPEPTEVSKITLYPKDDKDSRYPQAFTISYSTDAEIDVLDYTGGYDPAQYYNPDLFDGTDDPDWKALQDGLHAFHEAVAWTDVSSVDLDPVSGEDKIVTDPQDYVLEIPEPVRFLRILVTRRPNNDGAQAYWIQLGEVGIF